MKKEDYLRFIRKDMFIGNTLDVFLNLRARIPNNRNYANGRQEIAKFRLSKVNRSDGATKDMLDLWEKMEQKIDWTPHQLLAPKLNVAVTMTTQKERTFFIKAVDSFSVAKRKAKEDYLRGAMTLAKSETTVTSSPSNAASMSVRAGKGNMRTTAERTCGGGSNDSGSTSSTDVMS